MPVKRYFIQKERSGAYAGIAITGTDINFAEGFTANSGCRFEVSAVPTIDGRPPLASRVIIKGRTSREVAAAFEELSIHNRFEYCSREELHDYLHMTMADCWVQRKGKTRSYEGVAVIISKTEPSYPHNADLGNGIRMRRLQDGVYYLNAVSRSKHGVENALASTAAEAGRLIPQPEHKLRDLLRY